MPNIGAPGSRELRLDPYQSCNFIVEIEGVLAGGFSECGGLRVETEVHEYREGGVNDYVHRFAGPTSYPALVLKHGVSPIDGLWAWHQDVVAGNISRRNGTIYLLDHRQIPMMWWNFAQALPIKWTGPELRAESSAVAFESVELVHLGLSRSRLATATSAANEKDIAAELAVTLNISGKFF